MTWYVNPWDTTLLPYDQPVRELCTTCNSPNSLTFSLKTLPWDPLGSSGLLRMTWVWVNSGSWWWTGRPGVLRFMGSQRVGHSWATELNWNEHPILLAWPCNKPLSAPKFVKFQPHCSSGTGTWIWPQLCCLSHSGTQHSPVQRFLVHVPPEPSADIQQEGTSQPKHCPGMQVQTNPKGKSIL